ncbi:transketolase [Patescibacteria group bacterium]|nr:transketolase [Patescibacteria group bacterium]
MIINIFKNNNLDNLCVNTLRMLSVDMVERANSGHPGLPLGAAPMAYCLWINFLRYNPTNPKWINRDRFVLSAGHGSALLYSLLHLTGYKVSLNDLKNFRQWGSIAPGHPEYGLTPGVECTTGPLGQGFATGVGMAMGERVLEGYFNKAGQKIIDYNIYAIVSDGDLMEGITNEAASLAGSLKLGNIVYLYDSNNISIEGRTSITYCEDVANKYEALGWHVLQVGDGNDLKAIKSAITIAKKSELPSLIIINTLVGYGAPNKQDTPEAHGEPLGKEEVKLIREYFNWPSEDFCIPSQARDKFRKALSQGQKLESEWNKKIVQCKKKHPVLAGELERILQGKLPKGWDEHIKSEEFTDRFSQENIAKQEHKKFSTREVSGQVINGIAKNYPLFLGGSADLAPSTKTWIEDGEEFTCDFNKEGIRNIHFGVREHAMAACLNGLALTPGIKPFGATFLVFSDYMRGAMRVAALSKYPVIYVLTHDSVAVGEDGPTHEPIEQIMGLRTVPNLTVIRPADANETRVAWGVAISRESGPTALILSRQGLPVISQRKYAKAENLKYGAYIINPEIINPELIIIATGSEVSLALEVLDKLEQRRVKTRVVSMPSWELFEVQSQKYKDSVLPPEIKKRMSIEAGVSLGWERYVGDTGLIIGIDRYGASAKELINMEKFGYSVETIFKKIIKLI